MLRLCYLISWFIAADGAVRGCQRHSGSMLKDVCCISAGDQVRSLNCFSSLLWCDAAVKTDMMDGLFGEIGVT